MIEEKAKRLNEKYRVEYYDTIMADLIQKAYHREFINDSVEIGIFNKKVLDTTFFRVEVDTVNTFNNREYFDYKENEEYIVFTPVKNQLTDSKLLLMPSPYLAIYWDTTKTDYPYYQYPLEIVSLPSE